jgi:hypothetical protein
MQAIALTSRKIEFPSKKPFVHAIGLDMIVGMFLKNHKN